MDSISALLSPVSKEDELRALADSLRKRKQAADFYSISTIEPLQQMGQRAGEEVIGTAERQGALRQAMAQRQAQQEEAQAQAEARAREGELNRQASMDRVLARGDNVTVQAAKAPSGYYYVDPLNPAAGMKPVPGGPAEQKIEAIQTAADAKSANARQKWGNQIDVADRALKMVGPMTTGPTGAVMSKIWGSDQTDLAEDLNTLTAELTFSRLSEMKAESPMGSSGLGQVSDREGRLLGKALLSLQENQSAGRLKENLKLVKKHYGNYLDSLDGKLPPGYTEDGEWVGDKGSEQKPGADKDLGELSDEELDAEYNKVMGIN